MIRHPRDTHRPSTSRRALALLASLLLGAAACSTTDTPASVDVTAFPTPGAAAAAASDPTDAALLDADTPVPDGCADAVAVIAGVSQALGAVISGQDVAADIAAQVDSIDQALPRVPEAIRDDVTVVAETIRSVAQDFAALDYDPTAGGTPPPEAGEVVAELTERLQSPEYAAASQAIGEFFQQGCPS